MMIGKLVTILIIQLALINGELDFAVHIQGKPKKCQVSGIHIWESCSPLYYKKKLHNLKPFNPILTHKNIIS